MGDIKWALDLLQARQYNYALYADYYAGNHKLAFATEKFTNVFGSLIKAFADNLCRKVVNTVRNKLKVIGFSSETDAAGKAVSPETDQLAKAAWDIWRANRMDQQSKQVHTEALKSGDAYVIVWPDEAGEPIIYPQEAQQVVVEYDTERPGTILKAAKAWCDNEYKWRLNLYYPDRLEKYATVKPISTAGYATTPPAMPLTEGSYMPLSIPNEPWPVPNDYGRVPVFHFANDAAIGKVGQSELVDAIPLQNALNKSICDMMIAGEFVSFPQRWATGLEVVLDPSTGKPIPPFIPGVDRLWTVAAPDAKFGEFAGADPSKFIATQEGFRVEIGRVCDIPEHYLLGGSEYPSGEAMKTADDPLVSKIKDRHTSWGNVWEDILSFALQITGKSGVRLSCLWEDATPRNDKESVETLVIKKDIGVSNRQLQREAGYTDLEIEKMEEEKADEQESLGESLLTAFDQGGESEVSMSKKPVKAASTKAAPTK